MSDTTTQVDDAAPEAAATTTDDAPEATAERTYTQAEYRAVQHEARNLRSRLRDLEQQTSGHAPALAAAQQELEQIRSAHATLVDEVRRYRLHESIARLSGDAATPDDLRGIDPALAAELVRGVEWGDDHTPKGLPDALRSLVKRYPQLVTPPRVVSQAAAGRTSPVATTDQIQQQKRRSGNYAL